MHFKSNHEEKRINYQEVCCPATQILNISLVIHIDSVLNVFQFIFEFAKKNADIAIFSALSVKGF